MPSDLSHHTDSSMSTSSISHDENNIDDVLIKENTILRDRIEEAERRLQLQEDEVTILKTTVADLIRRLDCVESSGSTSRLISNITSTPQHHFRKHQSNQSASGRGIQRTMSPASTKSSGSTSGGYNHQARVSPTMKKWSSTSDFSHTNSVSHVMTPFAKREISEVAEKTNLVSVRSLPMSASTGHLTLARTDKHLKHRPVTTKSASFNEENGIVQMYLGNRCISLSLPTESIPGYSLSGPLTPPDATLKLEWVYGYRGRDARNNVFFLPTGEMVYFVAAVVVLYNAEEERQRHYLGHTDDVKCVCIHPNQPLVASGQVTSIGAASSQDRTAHIRVWDSVSLSTMHIIGAGQIQKAPSCMSFSRADGGGLLAAVDDSGEHSLFVWEWSEGETGRKLSEQRGGGDMVLALQFHPIDHNLIVTCGKNHVTFWTLETSSHRISRKMGVFERIDKPKYVLCLAFSEFGDLLTGDSNGNLLIWPRSSSKVAHCISGAHDGGVFSLCVIRDGHLLSGGGKDRRIIKWDASLSPVSETQLPEDVGAVRTISPGRASDILVGTTSNVLLHGTLQLKFDVVGRGHSGEVWALAAHPTLPTFATASHEGELRVWDASTQSLEWGMEVGEPLRSTCFHPTLPILALSCHGPDWMIIGSKSRTIMERHTDGAEILSCMSFSPDGRYLAIGSHDNHVYVYEVTGELDDDSGRGHLRHSRIGTCVGHSSYITHLDWSQDSQYLRTNSGDYEVLYWNAIICRQMTSSASWRDIKWGTHTCALDFKSYGIWQDGYDGTDINGCDRSRESQLLAVGDDLGLVHLYRYPCDKPKSQGHEYRGHASHVIDVRFLADDHHLISVGGKDMAVFQWQIFP